MSNVIVIGCADTLGRLCLPADVECVSPDEAAERGLVAPTVMVFTKPYELMIREAPTIAEAEPLPFHGYRGKRRGRRRY